MKKLKVTTGCGVLLDGVLFGGGADTVMIAISFSSRRLTEPCRH